MSGPTAPTDVMPGAEPFAFPGGDGPDGRTGVLLVHGFTGTPMSMRPVGRAPRRRGLRRPLPAAARPRHHAGRTATPAPTTSGRRRSARRSTRSPPSATASSWPGCRWAAPWPPGWPRCARTTLAGLVLVNPALLTQRLDAKLLPLIARLTGSWAPIASDIKKPGVTELAYPKLPDPGDDAAPRAVGGHPRRPRPGQHRR